VPPRKKIDGLDRKVVWGWGCKKKKKTWQGIKAGITAPPTASIAGKCVEFNNGKLDHTAVIF
jgi:hypothetical protein